MAALKAIPQNQFQNCFDGWIRRWHQCIVSQGEYFEGDRSGIQQWGMWHFYRDEFANIIVGPRKFYCVPELLFHSRWMHFYVSLTQKSLKLKLFFAMCRQWNITS